MKKIIVVFLLSLALVSCGKDTDGKGTDGLSIKDNEIIEVISNSNVEKILEEEDFSLEKEEDFSLEKEGEFNLEKEKELYNKSLKHYSNLSLLSKSNLDCDEIYPVTNLMGKKEKAFANEVTFKCNKIKNKAIKDFEKERNAFKISDCKYYIEKNEKELEELEELYKLEEGFDEIIEEDEKEKNESIRQEIETCEINYALKRGCDLLKNKEKKLKCEKYKILINDKQELEEVLNFNIESYIN